MSTIRSRSNWIFPLILAIGMGGISFWLDRITDIKTVEMPLNPTEPKYIIKDIQGEQFDEEGNIHQTMIATQAQQFPQQSVIYIDNPDINLYAEAAPLYHITAKTGQYHTDSRQIDLIDDVSWHKNARPHEPEAQLNTSILHIDTQTQSARTSAPIEYTYGLSHGTAQGFEYNKQQGFLNLDSRVRAIIYDPKQH
ncbi:LPS export ABC transporter periplasmic protein LptC [Neisseriaceae bacterium ESL0693]|nr:LPS export ABC transporter periplasmic protein LptC [Neisseriaceae bacterium ESL0693]